MALSALQRFKRQSRDLEGDVLIEDQRHRMSQQLGLRERMSSLLLGVGFISAAVPLAVIPSSSRSPSALLILLLIASYAVASRVIFEVGPGAAIPTQLVLVPMLFLVPVGLVPLLVAAGLIAAELVHNLHRGIPLQRVLVLPGSCWHAVGPVVVLLAWGEAPPRWHDWPIYLAALAAQFLFDFASSAGREWLAFGVSPRKQLRFFGWVWAVDFALAPLGLLAAFAAMSWGYAFLLVLPLIGLLYLFADQRRAHFDDAIALGHAYQGTAYLLGDVIEADDEYTGTHSREVVSLVMEVGVDLGLDTAGLRDAEFAALLHDVGKIRVPSDLINKPGPLNDAEWEVMRRHTIEGERMLEQVGGLLGHVGRIIRSSHERWDGGGYPDGLRDEQIPLIARIVSCCDAYDAMTSDRSYRSAMSYEAAIAELGAESGKQFDPRVVSALVRVLERRSAAR